MPARLATPLATRHPAPHPRQGLLARILSLLDLYRSRMRLGDLDDRMLRDIGLDRATAQAEAQRPLWDAPGHWIGGGPGKAGS